MPVAEAAVFLEALRQHYLGAVAPKRIRLMPSLADPVAQPLPVPSQQPANGYWSAFVAPDLAPIFADEPWLDQAPSPDAQAHVLARLQPIKPTALAAALARLQPAPMPVPLTEMPSSLRTYSPAYAPDPSGQALTPKAFLLAVMHDPAVALGLRIEAAKALLPSSSS
jgi:hypothetical protein